MRFIALVLIVSVTLAVGVSPAQEADVRGKVEALQKKIELLAGDEVKREIDPGALAASLGHDPERLFAAVRGFDFHPYRGALRGALGTLLAGAGNDVDRCLLLKDLLERAPGKPTVRFAFGELSEEQGALLVARALKSVGGSSATPPVKTAELLARVGTTRESLAAGRTSAVGAIATPAGRLMGGFEADRRTLEGALAKAGVVLAGTEEDGLTIHARALRSHVWLQIDRAGKWVDLDPSFGEAAVGWSAMPAARTAEALPEEMHHGITLRVILERLNGKALETETLYSGRRKSGELAGQAINLSILAMGYDTQKTTQPLAKQAPLFKKFQPVVRWGGVVENGRVFDVQGRAFQSKEGKFGGDFGDAAGERLKGAFGLRNETALAALRLELEIASPGRKPRMEKRDLLDRLRAGSREAGAPEWAPEWKDDQGFRLALFQSWTMWLAQGGLREPFLIDRLAGLLARDGGLPRMILDHADKKFQGKPTDVAARVDPLPLGLVGYGQTALGWAQGAFRRGEGMAFPDQPSLFVWKEALAPGKGNEVLWRGGVDLVHAPLGCVAKKAADAARSRLIYGLLLSEAESSMMEDGASPVFSTSAVFRKARKAKIPIVVLRDKVEGVTLGERAARLVREELKSGRVVVIPRDPVEIGGRKVTAWWRVDPVTGACLGVGDTGEGQGTSEGVLILENTSIPMVQNCMKFVICLNMGISSGQGMQDAGRECMVEFMRDYVESTLDNALQAFVLDPLANGTSGQPGLGMGDNFKGYKQGFDDMLGDVLPDGGAGGPNYAHIYDLAKGHLDEVAGKAEDLHGKMTLLLTMGSELAEYANEKRARDRNRR